MQQESIVAVGQDFPAPTPSNEDLLAIIQPSLESHQALPSIFQTTPKGGVDAALLPPSPPEETYGANTIPHGQAETAAVLPHGVIKQQSVLQTSSSQMLPNQNRQSSSSIPSNSRKGTTTKQVTIQDAAISIEPSYSVSQQQQYDPRMRVPPKSQTDVGGCRRTRKHRQANQHGMTPIGSASFNNTVKVSSPAQTPSHALGSRRQKLYALLKQVEMLQRRISRLPADKGRHYVQPYVRLGQASNLNLSPQSVSVAEKIVETEMKRKKEEIQKQAQQLLSQIELVSQAPDMVLSGEHLTVQAQCNCHLDRSQPESQCEQDETQIDGANEKQYLCEIHQQKLMNVEDMHQGTEIRQSHEMLNTLDAVNQMQDQNIGEGAHHQSQMNESSIKCDDCGHIGVTATENTSEAPLLNQSELNFEDQKMRAQHHSPGAGQDRVGSNVPPRILVDPPTPDTKLLSTTSIVNNGAKSKCVKCGSSRLVVMNQPEQRANTALPEPYRVKKQRMGRKNKLMVTGSEQPARKKSRSRSNKRAGAVEKPSQSSPQGQRTQQISIKHVRAQLEATDKADIGEESSSLRMLTTNKDSSGLPRELRQINLQIKMRNDEGLFANPDHAHSQPKIIHRTHADGSKMRRSNNQSGSHSRSKQKKYIKLANGDIMCGKCAVNHAPPPKKQSIEKSGLPLATPTLETEQPLKEPDSARCLAHSLGLIDGELGSEEKSVTDLMPTRRVESDQYPSIAIIANRVEEILSQEDENSKTDQVSDGSKKIHDSIEFTSQTVTARQNLNLREMSVMEQDMLSDALLSELRAIANGKFELGEEPHLISAERSDASKAKSYRLNLLSMGALTVKEEDNAAALDAQSNIATNEVYSQRHQNSMVMHSMDGSKAFNSNTRGEAHQKASGAYGSEMEYSTSGHFQPGGYALKQMVDENSLEDDESFEEEMESEFDEESEESLAQQSQKDYRNQKEDDELELHSHATSYSNWYVIDEEEEARLKQVAFEKYLAEQAIGEQIERAKMGVRVPNPRQPGVQKKRVSPKHFRKKSSRKSKSIVPVRTGKQSIQDSIEGSSIELLDRSAQYTVADASAMQNYEPEPIIEQPVTEATKEHESETFRKFDQQSKVTAVEVSRKTPGLPTKSNLQTLQMPDEKNLDKIQALSTLDANAVETGGDYDDDGMGDGDSKMFNSHDAKSFQTGIRTIKAFRPERLYEEANCIHVEAGSQNTRNPPLAANRNVAAETNTQAYASELQPTSNKSLPALDEDIDDETRAIKVKFQQDAAQSGTSKTRPIQTAYSLRELPNKKPGGSKGMLKTPTQNQQSQTYFKKSVQTSDQLLPSMKLAKRASQQEPELANFPQNYEGQETTIVNALDADYTGQANHQSAVIMGQSVDGQAIPKRILANLHTATSQDALELKSTTSPNQFAGTMSHGAIGQLKRTGNMRDDSADENQYKSQVDQVQRLVINEKDVSSPLRSNDLPQLNEEDRSKILSRGTADAKDQALDKQVQFPGSNQSAIASPVSREARSRKSRRRKPNSVEMVDRSQQDSRCEEKELSKEQEIEEPPPIKTARTTNNTSRKPQPSETVPIEPEKPEWVIVLGVRRPFTSYKPTAGRRNWFQPRSYATQGGRDTEPKFNNSTTKTKNDDREPSYPRISPTATGGDKEPLLPEIGSDRQPASPAGAQYGPGSPAETGEEYVRRMMKDQGLETLQVDGCFDLEADKSPQPATEDIHSDNHIVSSSVVVTPKGAGTSVTQTKVIDYSLKVTAQHSETVNTMTLAERQHILVDQQPIVESSQENQGQQSERSMPFQIKVQGSGGSSGKNDEHFSSIVDLPIETTIALPQPLTKEQRNYNMPAMPDKFQYRESASRRSPTAYRITRNTQRKGRSYNAQSQQNVNLASRRQNANQASYFTKQGYHGVRMSNNFQSQDQISPTFPVDPQSTQFSPKSGFSPSHGAIGSRSRTRGVNQQLYEVSPRNVAAKYSEGTNTLVNQAWNENTDKSLQNYIKKRANQRIKEINQEVDEAKPVIFDRNYAQQSSLPVENAYIRQGVNSSTKISQPFHGSQAQMNSSRRQRVGTAKAQQFLQADESKSQSQQPLAPPRVPSRIDFSITDTPQNQQILVSSNSLEQPQTYNNIDPALQRYVMSESKPSVTSFKPINQQKYLTITKGEHDFGEVQDEEANLRQTASTETGLAKGERMSNFSAQYRQFKSQRKGKTSERRNINPRPRRRNLMTCDMYFHGQLTTDDEVTQATRERSLTNIQNVDVGHRTLSSMANEVTMYRERNNESMPNDEMRLSQILVDAPVAKGLDHLPYPIIQQQLSGSRQCNDSTQMFSKLKPSYSTASKARILSGISQGPTPIKNQRMQFYPQTVAKKQMGNQHYHGMKAGGIKLNPHLASINKHSSTLTSGFVEFNLIHDNMHAPFLGPKHLKTTAYL